MIYHLLRLFLKLFSFVPWRLMYVMSDGLYYIVYYVAGYRRKIVRRNLVESFPMKSEQEIKRIEKKFYHFFVDMIFESCKLAFMSQREMKQRMKFINVEEVNAMIRQGRSNAIYLGHYGNWEWVSSMPLWLDKRMTGAQIYHKLSNKHMDRLMLSIRERMGAACVEMRKTARYVTELMAEHKVCVIGFIADQSPRKKDSRHFLHFLNHNTPVLTGTEKIIKHYGIEAWYLDVRRVKRGYYEAEFVRLHETPHALPDFELTAIYYQMLEKCIKEHPELYLWSHKRFRHAEKL